MAVTNHMALTVISQCLLSASSPQSPKPLYSVLNVELPGNTELGFTLGNLSALPTGGGESSAGHVFSHVLSSLGRRGSLES